MKVIFRGEIKRIPDIKHYIELLLYSSKVFDSRDMLDQKIFYRDDEGDIITVNCQNDMEQALNNSHSTVKFVFA